MLETPFCTTALLHFNGQIHHHHTTSQQITMKSFTGRILHMQSTPPPNGETARDPTGPNASIIWFICPNIEPNKPPKPPKPPPQFRFTMAIMACPKTWWNLRPVKTTRNTMGESGKFQELMDAWKESLWCWETPTRQSCSTLEIGKKSTNKHTKKIKHHRFPGLKIMLNHDKSTWCSGIIQSSVVKSSPWASTVPSLLAEKTEWRCHNHGHRKASSCPYQTSTKNTAESK